MEGTESKPIRALVYTLSPWTRILKILRDGTPLIDGLCTSIFFDIFHAMNLSYRIMHQKDNTSGMKLPNGTFVGIIRSLKDNEADISVNPLVPSETRWEAIDFTAPFIATTMSILGSSSPPSNINLSGIITVFDTEVWIAMLVTMIILVLVSGFRVNHQNDKTTISTIGKGEYSSVLFAYVAAIFLEGTPRSPGNGRARCLFGLWWLLMVLLGNAFCGLFRASMMVKREGEQVHSLQYLSTVLDRIKPTIISNSAYELYFKSSTSPINKKILQAVYKYKTAVSFSEIYSTDTLTKLIRGQAVIINERMMSSNRIGRLCSKLENANFYFSREVFYHHYYPFGVRRGFNPQLLHRINLSILRMVQGGIPDLLMTKENWEYERCSAYVTKEEDPGSPLGMKDIDMLFYFVLVSSLSSTLTFTLELTASRIMKY